MKSILVKSTNLSDQVEKYLNDAVSLIGTNLSLHKKSASFEDLYKTCLATTSVLSAMNSRSHRPSLKGLASIALRVPLILAAGQSSITMVELRRYVEITLWVIYFSDHRVEWQNFKGLTGIGFARDPRLPITFAAHKDLNSYFEYAAEFMQTEPSGIALKALRLLQQDSRKLNSAVHAGEVARSPHRNPPFDPYSEKELRQDTALSKRVFRHCTLLLAAFDKRKFDRLPALPRAYFDWLVGAEFRKQIRSGPFGVPAIQG